MLSLKTLLAGLEGRRKARLELVSGRRPRMVLDADGRRDTSDVKNLADQALTDDEVIALCEAAGAGKRLESLERGPATWSYFNGSVTYRVTVELRGREIAAVFVQGNPSMGPRKASQQLRARRTQPDMRATTDRATETPRSRRTVPPAGRRSESTPPRRGSVPPRRSTVPPKQARRATPRPAEPARSVREEHPTINDLAKARAKENEPTSNVKPDSAISPSTERSPKDLAAQAKATQHDAGRSREPAMQRAPLTRSEPLGPLRAELARAEATQSPAREKAAPERAEPVVPRQAAQAQVAPVEPRPKSKLAWPAEHASAARLVPILVEGRTGGASDLHVSPRRPPALRVAGALRPAQATIASAEVERAILSLVPQALRATFEERGGADFALEVPKVGRLRVNVTITLRGPKAAIRYLPREVPTLQSLGLPDDLADATKHHQGLVLVTGPSGHGKTSTLAALVNHINEKTTHHVITIEDPIEIVHPQKSALISQREVGAHTKSFSRAVKGALRQDPDVIVVGELRDAETVKMALSASETGHLVLGTMNTPSAPATIDALIDLFPPGDQAQVRATLAGGLKYIIGQRLVPKADGSGRAVALETLPGILPLWNLIRDSKTFQLPSLMQRGRGLGIVRLNDSLAELVETGAVNKEDALALSAAPDDLEALLGEGTPTPHREEASARDDLVGSLLGRAGAFFSRKGGD
jgi:twitching motility protein PilT